MFDVHVILGKIFTHFDDHIFPKGLGSTTNQFILRLHDHLLQIDTYPDTLGIQSPSENGNGT